MTDERIVEVERPSGGTPGWLILVAAIVAIVVGGLLLTNMTDSDARKDNAIAEAAHEVGKAASKAGDAARDAADKAGDKAAPPN